MIWLGANGSVAFSRQKVPLANDTTSEDGMTRLREAFGTPGPAVRRESQEPVGKALRR
jgi:hypothetical protein